MNNSNPPKMNSTQTATVPPPDNITDNFVPLGNPKCVISVPSTVNGGSSGPATKVTLRAHQQSTARSSARVSSNPRNKLEFLMDLQNKHRFSVAISRQNEVASAAIKSLDCLNDQIVHYIVSGHCGNFSKKGQQQLDDIILQHPSVNNNINNNLQHHEDEHMQESMVLIRGLLLDAQAKFRSMVEDNRQLAAHIDGSIRAANQEVGMLRAELASTNKRLSQISFKDTMGKADVAIQVEKGLLMDPKNEENEAKIEALSKANQQLLDDYKKLLEDHDITKVSIMDIRVENENLKLDNSRLKAEYANIARENEDIRQIKSDNGEGGKGKPSYGELKLELIQTRQELNRAKEILQDLKSDRKRLKGEKLDLLSQMKQLYATLEDKETELRDFIRNYEQRVKESDDMIKQLAREKEETDHEKWDIITKARDAAEKAVFFRTQLDSKEQQMKAVEAELAEAKKVLATLGHTFPSPTLALSTSIASSSTSTDNNFLMSNSDSYSIGSTGEDSCLLNFDIPVVSTPGMLGMKGLTSSTPVMTSSAAEGAAPPTLQRMCSQTSTISEIESDDLSISRGSNSRSSGGKNEDGKKKKKSFLGFTRVFSRNSLRRSVALTKDETESIGLAPSCAKLSVLNEDNYQEKLSIVEHMVGLNMVEWRAHQVLAWLEITLAMPMYAIACLHNIKSGRVLLGLSDSELSAALGVSNHIHRRKLRLSIEQHRNPVDIKYPKANEMDPTWIAHRFLPDLGLPQYTRTFEEQLCDGHIINTLTRRDLEKYFSVHRKFHQSSIMHAVELLRRIDFNKEKLYKRRTQSDETDTDLIVWTNERLRKWIRSIDLGEYGENLNESGVHGALIVLEPSFCSDTLSSVLGIPPSKSYIRRHLDAELDSILKPARTHQKGLKILRAALDTPEPKVDTEEESHQSKKKLLQRGSSQEETKTRLSFRGSIGKAFGKKTKNELKKNNDSDGQSKKTISGPIPMQHSSLSSLDASSELLKKGFCLPGQCVKPGGEQNSESDLLKSFNALSSVMQKQRAYSEEKIISRRSEEKLSRPTVVDFVRDLKKEADLRNSNASTNMMKTSPDTEKMNADSKSSTLTKRENHDVCSPVITTTTTNNTSFLSPGEGEVSLVSSSSQDTLTEHSVNVSVAAEKTQNYDKEQQSQTESLSQSSSTESAVEEIPSPKDVPCITVSTMHSNAKITSHQGGNVKEACNSDVSQKDKGDKLGQKVGNIGNSDDKKRSSFKDGFPHSTPV